MKRRGVSILLFGEGKADAIFLQHVARVLFQGKAGPKVRVKYGQGGSPDNVMLHMVKRELFSAAYDRSLLLLDSDRSITRDGLNMIKKRNITLVMSEPCCLEGMLLTILNDPPAVGARQNAKSWKNKFQRDYLKTDREADALKRFASKCPELFPADVIESRCDTCTPLKNLVNFLRL